jgi:hypothetical protein
MARASGRLDKNVVVESAELESLLQYCTKLLADLTSTPPFSAEWPRPSSAAIQ